MYIHTHLSLKGVANITLHRPINQHAANPHHRHVDIHDNNKIGGQRVRLF
jgi:hypothetical protein